MGNESSRRNEISGDQYRLIDDLTGHRYTIDEILATSYTILKNVETQQKLILEHLAAIQARHLVIEKRKHINYTLEDV